VSAWKERGRRDLAAALAELVVDVVARPAVDMLTFVPGDRARGRARGHVPAERLARELGRCWELPMRSLLRRAGEGKRQTGLPRAARGANVRGVFSASCRAPPRVALVDDVYTTGATVSACSSALRKAGARRVEVVCLARAVR
jgi:predicted amidophosphoribosyltransferase